VARFRWRAQSGPPEEPDPVFSYLSIDQGARMRSLVQRTFAERGIEVSLLADRVEAYGGAQYGLTNIAAVCRTASEKSWPRLIAGHIDRVLRALDAPAVADLDDEAILSRVFVRVMGASMVPDLSWYNYRRDLGGDLIEVLALDSEDSVTLLADRDVERFGVEELRHTGLMNLLAEPFGNWEEIEVLPGTSFTRVLGESVFTASRLLTLTDVIRRTYGDLPLPDGVLVCVPTRHQLAFHMIRDAGVMPTLPAMARFALTAFDSGVGPVSPHLFWHRDGHLHLLSRLDEDGALRIEVEGPFADVLERLAAEDD
jgi:hypothetical protein